MKTPVPLSNLVSQALHSSSDGGDLPAGSIKLESVSKHFRKRTISRQSYTTIKGDLLHGLFRRSSRRENFTEALTDFSLDLAPGSSVGIIGRNGSGKSTLLKLISGIYHPDTGRVRIAGRVSALIELGAGFHPDFTGRENVYLGGIMYGLSKDDIDARFEDIVRYAELEDFIDDPVRTYSSGMYMRLGFSLAVHTSPDILLIDEVLAVGDAAFISRCQETISDFKRQGKTLVLVSHDLNAVVRWCDEAIWLNGGKVRRRGTPRQIIDEYLRCVEEEEQEKLATLNEEDGQRRAAEGATAHWNVPSTPTSVEEKRWGNGDVEITRVTLRDKDGGERWLFHDEEEVTIEVNYRVNKPVHDLIFGVGIVRADGLEVHGTNTHIDGLTAPAPAKQTANYPVEGVYRYRMRRLSLLEDTYYVDVAAHREDGLPFDYHHRMHKFLVRSRKKHCGVFNPDHTWQFEPQYEPEKELSRLRGADDAELA